MILQKCCHDMDIMLWLADSKCESLSSFGELSYFTEENAPEGAPALLSGWIPHRDECAFYAPRFYLENLDGYLVRAVTIRQIRSMYWRLEKRTLRKMCIPL